MSRDIISKETLKNYGIKNAAGFSDKIVEATVIALRNDGAICDVGGYEAFLHRYEIDYTNPRPSRVFNVGDKVTAKVIKKRIQVSRTTEEELTGEVKRLTEDTWTLVEQGPVQEDPDAPPIKYTASLESTTVNKDNLWISRKALLPDPWDDIDYQEGSVVKATVLRPSKSGTGLVVAFEAGVTGVARNFNPQFTPRPFETVAVKIDAINSEKRYIIGRIVTA
mgnify:CR=1 FL=1|jgi:ribosomal protein S1